MNRYWKPALAAVLLAFGSFAFAVGETDESVNINTADAATMARVLKGVGQSRAEEIVRYREQHGQFVDIYELANVKGIGERTVEVNAERIVLKD